MGRLLTIGVNTIRGFAGPAFNFLIALIGIKYFGKDDWGIIINVLLWVYLILIITNFGNKEFLIRKYSREPSKINHHFFSSLISRSPLLFLNFLLFAFFPIQIAVACCLLSILLYCYSSLDSLIVHHQKFSIQLFSDAIGFLIIAGIILFIREFELTLIIYAYILATIIKILIVTINLELIKNSFSFHFSFKETLSYFPFFLIAFSGWLASKLDIYLVTMNLSKSEVSEYQLLSSSFLMINAGFAFIITPFSKHIYRLPFKKIKKIKNKLSFFAIPYLLISSLLIWLIMEKVLVLNMDMNFYYLSAINTFFPLLFFMDIMILNKKNQEKKITLIIALGILINLTFILLFIHKFRISGVLMASCISRLILLIIYKRQSSKK